MNVPRTIFTLQEAPVNVPRTIFTLQEAPVNVPRTTFTLQEAPVNVPGPIFTLQEAPVNIPRPSASVLDAPPDIPGRGSSRGVAFPSQIPRKLRPDRWRNRALKCGNRRASSPPAHGRTDFSSTSRIPRFHPA